jgi:cytochrome c nitrite reductase small subunit
LSLAAAIGVFVGVGAGIGAFTFYYAKGSAYLTNDPAACNQCHVMNTQYAGWLQSSHRAVAACNDCHTPPGHLAKYATKAMNGFRHSYAFTTGDFHEPIQIHARNRQVTERACRKCHQEIVQMIDAMHEPGRELSCVRCHDSVGHPH